jgi:recombination associated protein RdgC
VVRRELQARCAHIEATQGRQPGRREQRELKEAIEHELLPMAFPQTVHVQLWWDVQRQRLALDTTSAKRIDAVLSALLRAVPTLRVEPLSTAIEPSTAMANWLASNADEWPACFAPGRETELRADGDKPAVVRFARHILDAEEMRRHLAQGKRPTRLALDWQGRVSFVLTQNLHLRRIAFADGIDEAQDVPADERFDADAALATGELSALLSDLIEALGGCAPLSP